AINPEAGFFGVAPGTSDDTNPNAMKTLLKDSLFTNTALTDDGDVWWEDMTKEKPAHLTDWKRNDWTPESTTPAAHPNARFTTPAAQCPVIAPEWEDPKGVPISAILFGGRRSSVIPLVHESFNWQHGVFLGSIMASETTAAQAGAVGNLRRDPFAMLPFCGYNMGDYLGHWLDVGNAATDKSLLPKLYYVNWFRKSPEGKWLWPGFGENSRVLAWIFGRITGTADAVETVIGNLPAPGALDTTGLDVDDAAMAELLRVDVEEWRAEVPSIEEHYAKLGERLPVVLKDELQALEKRLSA
ncbi:MAG: phosphoenolpyruvate carboxykinase, partial [Actinomycetota bacterium]|nr:phosphoenolpyruvate carboxykinase [Actinomycetota bacterium]